MSVLHVRLDMVSSFIFVDVTMSAGFGLIVLAPIVKIEVYDIFLI